MIAADARAQLRVIDADVPAYDMRTLKQLISDDLSGVDSSSRMMLAFGVVALLLAAAGIFAVVAYSVSQRRHEIGVRMALGAQHLNVLSLVVSHSLKHAAIGLAIGIPVALGVARILATLPFGIVQMDVWTFASFTVLLTLVAAIAAIVPARAAMKVDPTEALRYE